MSSINEMIRINNSIKERPIPMIDNSGIGLKKHIAEKAAQIIDIAVQNSKI